MVLALRRRSMEVLVCSSVLVGKLRRGEKKRAKREKKGRKEKKEEAKGKSRKKEVGKISNEKIIKRRSKKGKS